jgi:hypothetical protein
MITWFSAGTPRWRGPMLGLGLALLCARPARAQDQIQTQAPQPPPAPAAVVETPPPPAPAAVVETPPPPAPAAVVETPPPPAPKVSWPISCPPSFEVGVRSAVMAKDPTGDEHTGAGLFFSWLTLATKYGHGSVVFDLESTRWAPGRGDRSDRAQVAYYGAGVDWSIALTSLRRGAVGGGVFVGAEATAGVLQSTTMTTSAVETGGVLQLMPHAGGAVSYRGVGLFVDAGWRFQLFTADAAGDASVGRLVVQGGLRVDMPEGAPAERAGLQLGYEAHIFSPNGSRIYGRYGGAFGGGSGPLLEHELRVTTGAHLPRRLDLGLALTYLGAGQAGGGTPLNIVGVNVVGAAHAFATRQLFNPYLGVRLGLAYMSSNDPSTFRYSSQIGALAAASAGVDVQAIQRAALRLGVAYDAFAYANDRSNASLSGYAVEAGLVVRL